MGARVRGDVVVSYAVLVVGSLVALYPFVSILLLALSAPDTRVSGFTVPDGLYLDNFVEAWQRGGFDAALWSSFVVTAVVVACAVVFSVLAGYALSILRTPLAGLFSGLLLIGIVVPYEATVIPLYHLMRGYGLLGELPAVILPFLISGFGVFMMRQYAMSAVPDELIDAARIDGASEFRTFWQVSLPLLAPGIVTVSLFTMVATWNNYFLPLIMLRNPDWYPLTLGLNQWNAQAATTGGEAVFHLVITGSLLTILPLIAAFLVLQRYWQSGLAAGSVKE